MMRAPGDDQEFLRAWARSETDRTADRALPWLWAVVLWVGYFLAVANMPGEW